MHRLNELTEVVLRRSELAVDFAAASLDELAKRDLASCAPGALQAIRLHVYQRSTIKDVRLVNPDGSVICSASSETLEFDKGWADRRDMAGLARWDALRWRRLIVRQASLREFPCSDGGGLLDMTL